MKTDRFRRSTNVDDFRDPAKAVERDLKAYYDSLTDQIKITNSPLAADLGGGDILPKKDS